MDWYLKALKKYAEFDGRSRRKEYWTFFLFNLIIGSILAIIDYAVGGSGYSGLVFAIAILMPEIAITVRRLHDTSRSGWWLLLLFIPIIGAIILLMFMLEDGKPGLNAYGPNPKGIAA